MKRKAIAAAIERDLLRKDDPQPETTTQCFSCGHGMTYRGERFCSDRCRQYYDAGNPGFAQWRRQPRQNYGGIKPTERGFMMTCAGCARQFESLGLRCCSPTCERQYRERQDNLAVMAEAGIVPKAKRQCAHCGSRIPTWRKGRRVSATTRFCSRRCAEKARQVSYSRAAKNDSKRKKSAHLIRVSCPA